MLLSLVQLSPDTHPHIQAACQRIAPGSVLVLIVPPDRTPVLYYEGGMYEREATRPPSTDERDDYARRAAGRAVAQYPTVARLFLPNATPADFLQEGWIDTRTWTVTWFPHAEPLLHFPLSEPRT
jgi:hypothetical protein